MPEMTPHTGLKKPLESENADITVINENMDKIDSALGDLAGVPTTAKDAAGAIAELFTNVSDGKALIASAITDKGVPTDANNTFAEMAGNIEAIPVGPDTSDATATAADIVVSKTAYGATGTKLTGILTDNPAQVMAASTSTDATGTLVFRLPNLGAYRKGVSGPGLPEVRAVDPDFISANIKAGVNVFGVNGKPQVVDTTEAAGSAVGAGHMLAGRAGYVNGARVVGTMPVRGNEEYSGWRRLSLAPVGSGNARAHFAAPVGAYLQENAAQVGAGNTGFFADDPNFVAANILEDVSIYGLQGTLKRGKKSAIVSKPAWATTFPISGIDFVPSLAFVVFPGHFTVGNTSNSQSGVTINSVYHITKYVTSSTTLKANILNANGTACDITISVGNASFYVSGSGTIYLFE
jgi:hypothetical protein